MGGKGSGRKASPCGTAAAYRRHSKKGEIPCQACKNAYAAYKRDYNGRTGRTKNHGYNRTRPSGTSRNWHQQQRENAYREYVKQWKLAAGACVDCGFIIDEQTYVCIDCDHRDPSQKSFTISSEVGRKTTDELQTELDKCDPVCRNCHALRTHKNQHHLTRRPRQQEPSLFDV
jgi:hypothetical protein